MLEQLLVWERDAFFMLNGSDSAFLDRFMWIYSGKAVWLPLAFFILVVLCYKKNWKEWLLILLAIVFRSRYATSSLRMFVNPSSPVSVRLITLILWIR